MVQSKYNRKRQQEDNQSCQPNGLAIQPGRVNPMETAKTMSAKKEKSNVNRKCSKDEFGTLTKMTTDSRALMMNIKPILSGAEAGDSADFPLYLGDSGWLD